MAYITRSELASRLPDNGEGLSEEQLDMFIEDAVSRAQAENPLETAYSRAGVARMAMADALEVMLVRDAAIEAPIVEALRNQAEKYFQFHDNAAASSSEPEFTPAEDSVANPFDSLWKWHPGYTLNQENPTGTRYPTWYG